MNKNISGMDGSARDHGDEQWQRWSKHAMELDHVLMILYCSFIENELLENAPNVISPQ
jgi:hypothetical protein